MTNLETRNTQTRIKHEILRRYLNTWGGIIGNGLRSSFRRQQQLGQSFNVRFVYVDCFAYKGRYATEDGQPVWGSPIIGIESLEKIRDFCQSKIGFSPEIVSIFFEKEREEYEELLETLKLKGLDQRVKVSTDFYSLRNGEIAVAHGDFRDYIHRLLDFTRQDYTWVFYLLDPYGVAGIPLDVVSRMVSQDHSDVMINFSYLFVHRMTGTVVSKTPENEPHRRYIDEIYGSQKWREIADQYYGELSDRRQDEMEKQLVDCYGDALRGIDSRLAVKTIRLKFPEKERAMFYLFLTTHDPTGAIKLNEILDDARLREYELRERHKNVHKRGGQLPLFPTESDPGSPKHNEPELADVASFILRCCREEEIRFREVLRRLADEPYYIDTIRKTLAQLKRQKRVNWSGQSKINNDTLIRFE